MRILLVSAGSLLFAFISFWIVKLWGQSQIYNDYKHPMYAVTTELIEFTKPSFKNLDQDIKTKKFLYLDVAVTQDQKLVVPKRLWDKKEKPIRYCNSEDIKNDSILLQDYKTNLKNQFIIFNIIENTQAVHENFLFNMQQLGLEKGDNFIVVSPFEAPIKALKDIAPSFLFGTTIPEIAKLIAMQSMYVIEAVNIRADVIIHPLKIRNQKFYNEDLVKEMKRRNKRIIIGPISSAEKEEAIKLKPYGLIIED
jgi:hypothetical protein